MKNLWFVTSDDPADPEVKGMGGYVFEGKDDAEEYALSAAAQEHDYEFRIYVLNYVNYVGKTYVPKPKIIYGD